MLKNCRYVMTKTRNMLPMIYLVRTPRLLSKEIISRDFLFVLVSVCVVTFQLLLKSILVCFFGLIYRNIIPRALFIFKTRKCICNFKAKKVRRTKFYHAVGPILLFLKARAIEFYPSRGVE